VHVRKEAEAQRDQVLRHQKQAQEQVDFLRQAPAAKAKEQSQPKP
jgi:hypothetical protein